jgi:DNA-binding GntR family transcriptional regulator
MQDEAIAMSEVVDQLRAAILRGDYAPRQRLVESQLTEQYRTSRFILRNALAQLANDGLVELQPRRGARVRQISVAEALEITEIRRVVEGFVAGRAAEVITDEQVLDLQTVGEKMEAAVASGNLLGYSELNAELHGTLRSIAGHSKAVKIIETLNAQLVRHQFRLSQLPGRPATSLPEHLAIIEAVCSRDREKAEAAMRDHLNSVLTALTAFAHAEAVWANYAD